MARVITLGALKIGGKFPVCIKAMLKTPGHKRAQLIREAVTLEKEGAQAIRLAVKEAGDAKLYAILRNHVNVPLVADIHFHYKTALAALEAGFEGIRLNPLNIVKPGEVKEVVRSAKSRNVSIRVGINSGGFKKRFTTSVAQASAMVKAAGGYLAMFEKEGFFNTSVSLKASDIATTIQANELFAKKYDYPLHLGVTASGPFLEGVVKSSIAMGGLLKRGIGNIIRVSLTAQSFWEVRVARYILQALGLAEYGPQIISCPTCSRCQVNLIDIVEKFQKELVLKKFDKPLRIALMGCVVNGPGEARQADIGVAFGNKRAAIFKGDKILRWSREESVVGDLYKEVRRIWK